MSDSKPTTISVQEIALIRSVEYRFGKKRYIFWHGGGRVFHGRCSHMHALRSAREAAAGYITSDKHYNKKAKI